MPSTWRLEFVGGAEVFVVAVAAGGEGVVIDDRIPEEAGGVAVGLGAGVDVASEVAEELGDLGVAVETAEDRPAPRASGSMTAWCSNLAESLSQALVAGVGVEVGEDFVHAAELSTRAFAGTAGRQKFCGHRLSTPGGKLDFDARALCCR